jgi:hypothetical protein
MKERSDRDALQKRLATLEDALAAIQRECDFGLESPEILVSTVSRIHSVTRIALGEEGIDAAAE